MLWRTERKKEENLRRWKIFGPLKRRRMENDKKKNIWRGKINRDMDSRQLTKKVNIMQSAFLKVRK